jgi:hypothetical protein
VIVSVIAAVVMVGCALALTPAFGMIGLCVGLILGRATQSIAYPALASAALGGPKRPPVGPLVRPALATVLLFAAACAVSERVLATNWLGFAGLVAVSFTACFAVTLAAGLGPAARGRLIERGRAVWRGLRRG